MQIEILACAFLRSFIYESDWQIVEKRHNRICDYIKNITPPVQLWGIAQTL